MFVSQLLNDEKMQELNTRVDVDGEDYTTMAQDFLREENLIADQLPDLSKIPKDRCTTLGVAVFNIYLT